MPGEGHYSLRLTPQAEDDMEEIWLHGAAEWSPEQADRYVDGITAVFDLLVSCLGLRESAWSLTRLSVFIRPGLI